MTNKNNKTKNQREFLTAGEFGSFVDDELDGESFVQEHASATTKDSEIALLNQLNYAYSMNNLHPDMPLKFRNTNLGEMVHGYYETKKASKDIDEGKISPMKFRTGLQDHQNDASSIQSLINLKERIIDIDGYNAYVYGTTGSGKTTFAALMSEISKRLGDYDVITNVKSFVEMGDADTYVWTFGDLLKNLAGDVEIEQLQDIERLDLDIKRKKTLFVFDEGSNYASGYSGDSHKTQKKLGKSLKLFRKVKANMLIIGHTGKDIHPDVRTLCDDIIHKPEQKTAVFYDEIVDREPKGKKFGESGLPEGNWNFRDKEITFWSWQLKTSDDIDSIKDGMKNKKERVIDTIENNPNMTQRQIADEVGCDQSYVSQIMRDIKNMELPNDD